MATEADNFFSRWSRRKLQVRVDAPATPAPPAADRPAPGPVSSGADAGIEAPAVDARRDPPAPLEPAAAPAQEPAAATPTQPPTMEDLALLGRDSSYARFVARDVSPDVRNAAMRKLFSDPHYKVMDGLDIYIDDYGKPDPLPAGMLRQMVQSKMLGLFAAEDAAEEAAAAAARNELAQGPSSGCAPTGHRDTAASAEAPKGDRGASDLTAVRTAKPGVRDTASPTIDAVTLANAPDEDTHLQLQPVDDAGCAGADAGTGQDAGRQRGRAG